MKKISVILLFLLAFYKSGKAQGEIDDQEKIFFRNEKTWAIGLTTSGIGGGYRYARRHDGFRKTSYEIELYHIKHEKEYKVPSYISQQIGSRYVYGKLNSFYALNAGIGFQRELFGKLDKGSISVRYFYNIGPSFGFLKPVYYYVILPDGSGASERKTMKFEQHLSSTSIEKNAPFYIGLSELKLVPGIYGKFGFTFEFSKVDAVFNAIETGIILEAYPKKIEIMANDHNHFLFFSLFINYRFGKIVDAQFIEKKKNLDSILAK